MGGDRARRLCLPVCLALALLFSPTFADAASPLKVREVFPGSNDVGAEAEFVELQMTADGQNDIDGQVLRFYDSDGDETSSFTVPFDVLKGESQRMVLFATEAAEDVEAFGNFVLPDADRIDPAGGAVCFTGTGAGKDDCVTWGSIPIFEIASGFPDRQSANAPAIADGSSLTRTVARECPTYLDSLDDMGNSALDFELTEPTPRNNSVAPSEVRCPPNTLIQTFPANPTNSASASFTYEESPGEEGTTFECALDWEGALESSDFAPCPAGGVAYPGPLAEGIHRFAVRAVGEGGPDPTPATRTWTVDTTPPDTTIDSTPASPGSGFSASFAYHSSEPSSSFRCQLDDGAIQVCSAAGKTYFTLSDGSHVFRVWAADNAGNEDPSPAEHVFVVQTVLGDLTPPDTSVVTGPSSPSPSPDASFRYASSEKGSSFECRLGAAPFAPCDPGGSSYSDLRNGSYTFEVRATDPAGNTDSLPAAHSWRVAAPLPNTRITKAPPGRVSLRTGKTAKLKFAFVADKPGSSFRCRLDKKAFKPCGKTKTVRAKPGRHRFEVYAVDALGNVETAPARRIVRIVKQGGGDGLFRSLFVANGD